MAASSQRNREIDSSRFALCASGPWERAGELLDELRAGGLANASVADVIASADRRGRALEPSEPPLAAIEQPIDAGFGWDADDSTTTHWYPQGITSSHDACAGGRWSDREVLMVSWVRSRNASVRVSVCELGDGAPRYRHVLLVEPVRRFWREAIDLKPIRVHAGGIVWRGGHLYVADTLRGLRVFAVDEMLTVATDGPPGFVGHRNGRWYGAGHRYVMPQIGTLRMPLLRSIVDRGPRFSFVSLRRRPGEADSSVISGEYRRKQPGARVVEWPVFADGANLTTGTTVRASSAVTAGRANLQGALAVGDRLLLASSGGGRGGVGRLAVYEGDRLVADHPWANGPEDLAYAPVRDLVLSLTEHPVGPDSERAGRVVFGVRCRGLVEALGD